MDLRLLTATTLTAFLWTAGSLQVVCADAPPAPRPWSGDAVAPTNKEPMTEPNGSRLRLSDKAIEESQDPSPEKPRFSTDAPLRDDGGYYMGVSVGMNFAQGDDVGAPVSVEGDLAPVGGFKLGYVYPFDAEPIDQFMDETGGIGLRLAGAMEVEAFYLRNDSEITAGGAVRDLTIDAGYFMVNAFLKARVSQFTFYAGPGVGLAWAHSSGDALTEDQDDAFLAYQMSGGVEYLFANDWSIFTEYKWLVTDDFSVDTAAAGNTDFGMFEQNLISFGLKRHF